jgi:hypothetical protein
MPPMRGIWSFVKIVDIERDDLQQLTSPSRPLQEDTLGLTRK